MAIKSPRRPSRAGESRPYGSNVDYAERYREKLIEKGLVITRANVPHKCDGDLNGHHAQGCNRRIKAGAKYLFNKRDASKTRYYYHSMFCARKFMMKKQDNASSSLSLYEYPNV